MFAGLKGVRPHHVIADVWLANLVGASILLAEYLLVLPFPERDLPGVTRDNVVLAAVSVALTSLAMALFGGRRAHRALDWTVRREQPRVEEQQLTLDLPYWLFKFQILLWSLSCVAFYLLNADVGQAFALQMAIAVLSGGLATATVSYLVVNRLLRPALATVLELRPPMRGESKGVGHYAVSTWALTTGVPLLALVAMVAFAPYSGASLERIAASGVVVGLVIFLGGLGSTVLFAKAVGEPLGDLTTALAEVEAGDLDVRVPVDDSGEIGQLQAGLNRMVAALREREQLRDLFGRHVGVDVARLALEHGVALGGEEREAAALFVDVIGSTTYAAQRSPAEVVAALNRFFEVVVDVVSEHGGLVNKFEGDAALCIFGAPLELDDPAAAALTAARVMAVRLRERVPDLDAGIGVSHGLVIAGNIGSVERLEYTVIGDPVNEAARLTEQAKERPERVVASGSIVERAAGHEQANWRFLEPLMLRGRLTPTTLAVPS
jgi:adenylate cyclase